jgi:hypothetical protein
MALQEVGSTVPFDSSVIPFDAEPASAVPAPVAPTSVLGSLGVVLLESDWRGKPMISLKDGMFEDALGHNFGKEFEAFFETARPKYAWQVPNGSAKTELAYTYELPKAGLTEDEISTNKKGESGMPISLAAFKADMESKGKEVVMKTYMEVDVVISAPGTEQDGSSKKVSVSPTSAQPFCDFLRGMDRFGMVLTHAIRFKVGAKVKHGDNPAYFPWLFEIVTK